MSDSLWPHALYSPWNSPRQNTQVARSPGDLPNPGSNSGLLHYRRILYLLSHQGSPSSLTRESSHLNLDSWQKIRQLSESLIPGSCQSHVTLCDTMYCILPGSSVHGVLKQENWSGLLFPSPEHLPDPRIEPGSPVLYADSLPSQPQRKPTYPKTLILLWEFHHVAFRHLNVGYKCTVTPHKSNFER